MLLGNGSDADGAVRAGEGSEPKRLRGWKEIGRHFGVDERTVKRWEAQRGLPVHRVPGEPRAPVFAYSDELAAWFKPERTDGSWLAAPDAGAVAEPGPAIPSARRPPWLLGGVLLLLAAFGAWQAFRADTEKRVASSRVVELASLAGAQVAAVNDQLDSQPGTVAVRAALAEQAVDVLGQVATLPDSGAALKREAAEGYRRLAVLQNAIDRPSLRDRAAARQSVGQALALLEGDDSPDGVAVRARVLIEGARQAGGDGDLAGGRRLLDEAAPVVARAGPGDLQDEYWLTRSETLAWSGDYAGSAEAARRISTDPPADVGASLRQMRALDLEGEALYYIGDLEGALARYDRAIAIAEVALLRWPADSRLRWSLLRHQWNRGSTLTVSGQPRAAEDVLRTSLDGWEALAAADPTDEAVGAWVRASRLSYGQALEGAGKRPAAISVLSEVVAERRRWLAARPDDADRRRMLMRGLAVLGDALAPAQRTAEACVLYSEARGIGTTMAADGQLTGFDRRETLRLLEAAAGRSCAGAATS